MYFSNVKINILKKQKRKSGGMFFKKKKKTKRNETLYETGCNAPLTKNLRVFEKGSSNSRTSSPAFHGWFPYDKPHWAQKPLE
jgi:hypothetical protein